MTPRGTTEEEEREVPHSRVKEGQGLPETTQSKTGFKEINPLKSSK